MVWSVASQSRRRLGDHQRMIGDHDGRMAGAADGALDETDAVMRAGGIDAFAAPVGDFDQRHGGGEKGGKAGARNVAVGARGDPARDQTQRHAARTGRQRGSFCRFFEIEQAEIIFPALAHHRLFGALDRIGIETGDFLHDLALQIAGVGRDPKARAVLLGPQRCGRQIAQGLAGAGARFDQRHAGRAAVFARAEGIGRRIAIGLLFGARRSHQLRQPGPRFFGIDRLRSGHAHRRFVFPHRQARARLPARRWVSLAAWFRRLISAARVPSASRRA